MGILELIAKNATEALDLLRKQKGNQAATVIDEMVEGHLENIEGYLASSAQKPHGCKIGCPEKAEWQIFQGDGLEDYTESCLKHIPDLMNDSPEQHLFKIGEGNEKTKNFR